jgi:hypothetical protein
LNRIHEIYGMLKKTLVAASIGVLAVMLTSCERQPTADIPSTLTVTIDNVQPRLDTDGHIIDAHGGCIQFFNGRFYLYGTAYGTNLNSMDTRDYFVAYSSSDLQQWKLEGHLIPDQPLGVYTRPYVIFNAKTHKYVLWYNWFPKLWDGQAGVATSDSPTGPFTVVTPAAHLRGTGPGDGSLFEDDDGTAYYIYTDMKDSYSVRIERLTPDYLDSNGEVSDVLVRGAEAPLLFRRGNLYYSLCGSLCPDCPKGNEVYALTSTNALGPFAAKLDWNLNRRPETGTIPLEAATNHILVSADQALPNIPAQQTWVLKIPTPGDSIYLWLGDRWGSTPDGQKGHDFQFWSSPLEFAPDGKLMPLKNIPRWQITWEAKASGNQP